MMRAGLLVTCCWLSACSGPPAPDANQPDATTHGHMFVDVAPDIGLDFHHVNGMFGESYLTEIMGAGAALVDYDNDGDLDVFAVQGEPLAPDHAADGAISDQLYRNLLMETGKLEFENVTQAAGLGQADGYGMGVATGDFNNDGWTDLYVTNYGDNRLWQNRGDGTFEDITIRAAANDDNWSTSAVFFDYDADGWLDLYIANYIDYRPENHRYCRSQSGRQDYCSPGNYNGSKDLMLLNRTGTAFVEHNVARGLDPRPGLGVITGDFDNDGLVDLYVANDLQWNFLWVQRNGDLEDIALESGSAVNMDGRAEASMGLEAADIDNDGDEDLLSTHLKKETNTLYLNDGTGIFDDMSGPSGLGLPSTAWTGFGVVAADFNNDSRLDIVIANGAVTINEGQAAMGHPFPLGEPNLLFLGEENAGTFRQVAPSEAGESFGHTYVSRGVASGDIDNDGDIDLLISNNNGPLELLVNQLESPAAHWVSFRIVGDQSVGSRDMLGANVTLRLLDRDAPPSELVRRVRTDGSYASARDPRVHFGVGAYAGELAVEVQWPDRSRETFSGLTVDARHTLIQGSGSRGGD